METSWGEIKRNWTETISFPWEGTPASHAQIYINYKVSQIKPCNRKAGVDPVMMPIKTGKIFCAELLCGGRWINSAEVCDEGWDFRLRVMLSILYILRFVPP